MSLNDLNVPSHPRDNALHYIGETNLNHGRHDQSLILWSTVCEEPKCLDRGRGICNLFGDRAK